MKARSISTFKYNLRAPGSQAEDPIRLAVGQTVLGKMIVDRSQRGICAIFLGEDAQSPCDQPAAAFPAIELQADQASLEREPSQIIALIDKDQSEEAVEFAA